MNDIVEFIYKNYKKKKNTYLKSEDNMYFNMIKDIFENFYAYKFTDMVDFKCYEYIVLLHENQNILDDDIELMKKLNRIRYDLYLYVSTMGKYYYYFINKTMYINEKFYFSKSKPFNVQIKNKLNALDKKFEYSGYRRLFDDEVNSTIKNIQTEFCEKGEATVFSCLFTDYV